MKDDGGTSFSMRARFAAAPSFEGSLRRLMLEQWPQGLVTP